MKILLVHEYYRRRGGEDVAFETDAELLEQAGHQVAKLTFHNDSIAENPSLLDRLKLFGDTIWSRDNYKLVKEKVAAESPDVVHFHNTFPLASPAAISAAHQSGAAVVMTLHNYRLLCLSADFYRDGGVCEDCLHAPAALPGVLHSCYRSSHSQSAAVAAMLAFHKLRRTWAKEVDLFIAPTRFLREKLIEGGLPGDRIRVRASSIRAPEVEARAEGDSMLYVGRLEENKGVSTLLRAWQRHSDLPQLRIAGSGQMEASVRSAASTSAGRVEYLGQLPRTEVFRAMLDSRALLFPSIWYETQGLTLLEAAACGLPAIASRLGAVADTVTDHDSGLLFEAGNCDALSETVRWAVEHPDELRAMGNRARERYESLFSPERSLDALISCYEVARGAPARPSTATLVGGKGLANQ